MQLKTQNLILVLIAVAVPAGYAFSVRIAEPAHSVAVFKTPGKAHEECTVSIVYTRMNGIFYRTASGQTRTLHETGERP